MIKEHICRGRPGYKSKDDPWADGLVGACKYHGQKASRVRKIKGVHSKADGRAADRGAGVIGTQRDGFISG